MFIPMSISHLGVLIKRRLDFTIHILRSIVLVLLDLLDYNIRTVAIRLEIQHRKYFERRAI